MSPDSYLTKEGHQKLTVELLHLKKIARSEIASKINEARELGGVDENSMYDTYIAEQGYIEGRIKEIEEILGRSEIIDTSNGIKNGANVGNIIHVSTKGKEDRFMLVGSAEADPMQKKISIESPVGKALLGVKPGDTVVVETPQIKIEYTIKAVK